ncbi:hypothetical protein Moror_10829 [Moniliophthora roreri MCA 2997]|uniref:BTB domain-containing protein n=2 Tax=Moniliophthora roreri TaxID=221103 RepID=V2Y8M6_MONRO|nr:hypothetical protein Moror_10829 [Moniliophthora roreri MCA 2997]
MAFKAERLDVALSVSDDKSSRWVSIGSVTLELPNLVWSKLSANSVVFHIHFSSQHGKTNCDPILLKGHTMEPFKDLLSAVITQPLPDPLAVPLNKLLSIAELALRYRYLSLQTWTMDGVRQLSIPNPHSPPTLRHSPESVYIRILKLALRHQQHDISQAIQYKWVSRLHWRELSPVTAICKGHKYGLRYLLSHACYVHMVDMEPLISIGLRVDIHSQLTRAQILHVFCGYHSLRAYWEQLQRSPPRYAHSKECLSPKKCQGSFDWSWKSLASSKSSLAPVDVLRRLLELQSQLGADPMLKLYMPPVCRENALEAIARRRESISHNLHHHFDI